jgi:GR25 family glycosyltransferase involved in LPS biosynthesis
MNTNYSFFDDIICINLEQRPDRKINSETIFKKYNIPARIMTVKKHEKGGRYGCFDSHIKILKEAYEKNLEYILVFEDDIIATEYNSEKNISEAINFMKNNKEWDIFYLGFSVIKDSKNGVSTILDAEYISENIIKYNPYFTHALCYNKASIKKILDNYEDYIEYMHYDMYIANYLELNNYCYIPNLFDQDIRTSDNDILDLAEFFIRNIATNLTLLQTRLIYLYYIANKKKYYLYFKYVYLFIIYLIIYTLKKITIYKQEEWKTKI